ncbi:MAG: DUF5995 family protein [Candidatus Sericytochromatia bacterium]
MPVQSKPRPTAIHARPLPRRGAQPAAPTPAARPVLDAWLASRPAATVGEGLARLGTLARRLESAGDRRAVFASTYFMQIQAFADELKTPGRYQNPAWMEKMVLDFLQRYLDAFDAYERQDFARVPAAWKAAFDRAVEGNGPVVGDLLLAMNAHINHDLPLTLAATGATKAHRADYMRFNDVLCNNIDGVQDLVSERFLKPGNLASRGDRLAGPLDESATGLTIRRWRDAAWTHGQEVITHGKAAYPAILRRAGWRATAIGSGVDALPTFLAKRGLL